MMVLLHFTQIRHALTRCNIQYTPESCGGCLKKESRSITKMLTSSQQREKA